MKAHLELKFKEIFGREDGKTYFSPGRVNLMGEYTDFNGGFVFSCGLEFGSYGIIGIREDREIHVFSKKYSSQIYTFELDTFFHDPEAPWTDYIKGVIAAFYKQAFIIDHGFDLYIFSNMPVGIGLASSASLEMLLAMMINDLFDYKLDHTELAFIGHYAEQEYLGLTSSVMDQFTIMQAKRGQGVLLNTKDFSYESIPIDLTNYQMYIINSNINRELSSNLIVDRYHECMMALDILKPLYQINSLCELQVRELINIEKLVDPIVFKRIRHVVTEQDRTIRACKHLREKNMKSFCDIMYQSQLSLKEDFEVSRHEINVLINSIRNAGAIGAKMTCVGFGGCIVAIVSKDRLEKFIEDVGKNYTKEVGHKPTFYKISAEEGARKI